MNEYTELYHTKNNSSNNKKSVWDELQEKGELTRCTSCNRKCWKFWMMGKKEMTRCAICTFNHE